MKKILLILIFLLPSFTFASSTELDLGYGWSLQNVVNNNYRGSTLYYRDSIVHYFHTCADEPIICDTVTSGLKAGSNGVFIEYFQGGAMDAGIYRMNTQGNFVGQNTDQKNICSTVVGSCQYLGFSVVSKKYLRLHYSVYGKTKSKLIPIK